LGQILKGDRIRRKMRAYLGYRLGAALYKIATSIKTDYLAYTFLYRPGEIR